MVSRLIPLLVIPVAERESPSCHPRPVILEAKRRGTIISRIFVWEGIQSRYYARNADFALFKDNVKFNIVFK